MKTKGFMSAAVMLMLAAGCFLSCDKNREVAFDEPIDVPFTEYSPLCNRKAFHYSNPDVVMINSEIELRAILECYDDFPVIDFSKYTLIFVSGMNPSGGISHIRSMAIALQQYSTTKYMLSLEIPPTEITMSEPWNVALVVNKLSRRSAIELDIAYVYPN